jgi:opacity protein-like surface antigen
MSAFRRRALLAAVSALLLAAPAADAACVETVCVTTSTVEEVVAHFGFEPTDVGGGPGQICAYSKFQQSRQPGTLVAVPERVFWEDSWEWGEEHPKEQGYWDWRLCSPLQCRVPEPPEAALTCATHLDPP